MRLRRAQPPERGVSCATGIDSIAPVLELTLGPLRRVLAIGAHSDDIEIGCGGAMLRIAAEYPGAEIVWVCLCGEGRRGEEAKASAEAFLPGRIKCITREFRDGFLPTQATAVKEVFEDLKGEDPDLVLTHQPDDLHQDHRLLAESALQAFRDHLIWGFEIPKYDGDLGRPSVYLPLDAHEAARKVEHLMEHFASQRSKRWFTEDLFRALMRLRGMEANTPTGYAEAFYLRKAIIGKSSASASA
jgi:LmbE family N-acetylglucosaminyl deacetylase